MSLSRLAQQTTLTAMRWTGADRLFGRTTAGSGAILTLHRVRPQQNAEFSPNGHLEVEPEFLAEAVDHLLDRGIDFVDLDEALRRVSDEDRRRFVVITMDDGYRDNAEIALPILRARGVPFTVFLCTGFADRSVYPWWMALEEAIAASPEVVIELSGAETRFPTATTAEKYSAFGTITDRLDTMSEDTKRASVDRLARAVGIDTLALVDDAFMTWDEVKAFAAEPLVTIGAHTHNHFALSRLPLDRARREVLHGAEAIARHLGRTPRHFAYPYGYASAVGEREYDLLAELGFATAVRTEPGVLTPALAAHATAWPRISLNGHFQKLRYLDVLLSGVPFAARTLIHRVKRLGRAPATAPAAASSG